MTDNIIAIRGGAIAPPVGELPDYAIKWLRETLADAEAGNVAGYALVAISKEGFCKRLDWSHPTAALALAGLIGKLNHQFQSRLEET